MRNYVGCVQEIAIVHRTKVCSRSGRAAPCTTSGVTSHEQMEVSPEMVGCAASSGSFIDSADISSKERDHLIKNEISVSPPFLAAELHRNRGNRKQIHGEDAV